MMGEVERGRDNVRGGSSSPRPHNEESDNTESELSVTQEYDTFKHHVVTVLSTS